MKFIKGLLITVLALILIYVILALFAPSSTHVERSMEMNAPAEAVWSKISEFKNWENWSPWKEKDPSIVNTYTGNDGEVGSKMSWTSDSSGVGYMEIKETVANEKLVAKLAFTEPWESSSEDTFILTEADGKTTVSWSDHMEIPFMARPMMMFMGMNTEKMDEMMGPDFEKGLANIKKLAEESNSMPQPTVISESEMTETTYLGIRHKTAMSEVMKQEFFATNYGKLMGALGEKGIEPSGMPVAIYYSWNEEDSTVEVVPAIPVTSTEELDLEGMEIVTLPAGTAVKAAYYGPYEGAMSAHMKIGEYCKTNAIETGIVMEEYANDPTTVESPNEYLTNIYYFKQ